FYVIISDSTFFICHFLCYISLSLYSFSFLICFSPSFTLFPYTTLFRSAVSAGHSRHCDVRGGHCILRSAVNGARRPIPRRRTSRSEEHTSELQSRFDLVCRLLLEIKNNKCILCRQLTLSVISMFFLCIL